MRDVEEAGSESSRLVLPGIVRCALCISQNLTLSTMHASSAGCADMSGVGAETRELGSAGTACKAGGCEAVSSSIRGRQQTSHSTHALTSALSCFPVPVKVVFSFAAEGSRMGPVVLPVAQLNEALPVGWRVRAVQAGRRTEPAVHIKHLLPNFSVTELAPAHLLHWSALLALTRAGQEH